MLIACEALRGNPDVMTFIDFWRSLGLTFGSRGPYLAGGFLRRAYLGPVTGGDVDIFFGDLCQFERARDALVTFAEAKGKEVTRTRYAVTAHLSLMPVQLVKPGWRWGPDLATLLSYFDLSHCQFGYDGTGFYATPAAVQREIEAVYPQIAYDTWRRLLRAAQEVGPDGQPRYVVPDRTVARLVQWMSLAGAPGASTSMEVGLETVTTEPRLEYRPEYVFQFAEPSGGHNQ